MSRAGDGAASCQSASDPADGTELSKANADQKVVLRGSYWLMRIVLLRALGFVYAVAFCVALHQNRALIGDRGLLPARSYLEKLHARLGDEAWRAVPMIFWLTGIDDVKLDMVAVAGLALSLYVMLTASASMLIMLVLWALYMSIVNVGQRWYGFGWESQLLETGFLAAFMCPVLRPSRFPNGLPTPYVCIYGFRWLLLRIMLGAGLIKIRGDRCWRDLTCMDYFYETQPIPNPLSPMFHRAPPLWHRLETMGNHLVELVLPFFLFLPRPLRVFGGVMQLLFQAALITSGNLSFLNWLTTVPTIAALDDQSLAWLFSKRAISQAIASEEKAQQAGMPDRSFSWILRTAMHAALLVLLSYLSIPVVQNLLSSSQAMNTSFDSLRLVNTYGAFGSVTKERTEFIILGTNDTSIGPSTVWYEYEFNCKPGSVDRRPCLLSPYHYRLDWLLWFAAFQTYQQNPWLIHLAVKLLQVDPLARSLIARDPFQGSDRPNFIKADHFRYKFAKPGSGVWWERERIGEYFPPLSLDNPSVKHFCHAHGWTVE